jgi:hypothetical protein
MVNRKPEINKSWTGAQTSSLARLKIQNLLVASEDACAPVLRPLTLSSNPQFLSQLQFQPIHFPIIGFVIITAQVQQPMKDQLFYFI